jgi:hypothetical protein
MQVYALVFLIFGTDAQTGLPPACNLSLGDATQRASQQLAAVRSEAAAPGAAAKDRVYAVVAPQYRVPQCMP